MLFVNRPPASPRISRSNSSGLSNPCSLTQPTESKLATLNAVQVKMEEDSPRIDLTFVAHEPDLEELAKVHFASVFRIVCKELGFETKACGQFVSIGTKKDPSLEAVQTLRMEDGLKATLELSWHQNRSDVVTCSGEALMKEFNKLWSLTLERENDGFYVVSREIHETKYTPKRPVFRTGKMITRMSDSSSDSSDSEPRSLEEIMSTVALFPPNNRPRRSALRLRHIKSAGKESLSVRFSDLERVAEAPITLFHREARMPAGERATYRDGTLKPLRSTKTGEFVENASKYTTCFNPDEQSSKPPHNGVGRTGRKKRLHRSNMLLPTTYSSSCDDSHSEQKGPEPNFIMEKALNPHDDELDSSPQLRFEEVKL